MLAGDLYIADDPELARGQPAGHAPAGGLQRAARPTPGRCAGASSTSCWAAFGAGSEIRPPLYCDYGYHLRIGARTFVNFGLVALDVAPITIGDDVQIGPERPAADADPPGRARAPPGQVGGGPTDRHRRQRLARRRRHRAARRDHRREHRRRRGRGRRPGTSRPTSSPSATRPGWSEPCSAGDGAAGPGAARQ